MTDLPIREILINRDAETARQARQEQEKLRAEFLERMCCHTDDGISEAKASKQLTIAAKKVGYRSDQGEDHIRADEALTDAIVMLAALSPCGSPVRESAAKLLAAFEMLPKRYS